MSATVNLTLRYPSQDMLRRRRSTDLVALSLESPTVRNSARCPGVRNVMGHLMRALAGGVSQALDELPGVVGVRVAQDNLHLFKCAALETVTGLEIPQPIDNIGPTLAALALGVSASASRRLKASTPWDRKLRDNLATQFTNGQNLPAGKDPELNPDGEAVVGEILTAIREGLMAGTVRGASRAGAQAGCLLAALRPHAKPGLRRVAQGHYLAPGHESIRRHARVREIEIPGEGFAPVGQVVIDHEHEIIKLKRRPSRTGKDECE